MPPKNTRSSSGITKTKSISISNTLNTSVSNSARNKNRQLGRLKIVEQMVGLSFLHNGLHMRRQVTGIYHGDHLTKKKNRANSGLTGE